MKTAQSSLKYLDLYNSLHNAIQSGLYPAGSVLPTESMLMEQFEVSRNTVRKALSMLQEHRLITTQRGSGSVVNSIADRIPAEPQKLDWGLGIGEVEFLVPKKDIMVTPGVLDTVPATVEIANCFGLTPGTPIFRVQRLWSMEERPYNYMVQYVNPVIFPDFAEHMPESRMIDKILKQYHGLSSIYREEHISCCAAGFVEAQLLNVPVGSPLMYTKRLDTCDRGVFEYSAFYADPAVTGYVMHLNTSQLAEETEG